MQKKPSFEIRTTKDFDRQFVKLTARDARLRNRITARIDELTKDPYAGTLPLIGKYMGWRKDRIGDYRIILAICEECKQIRNPQLALCVDCQEVQSNTVKLMEIGHRSSVYED